MKKFKSSWLNWRKLIIDDRDLSFGAKAIALYLNTYMNDSHDMAFPSLRRIEGEMSISRKTVIKHLGDLEAAGYIKKGRLLSPATSQYHNSYTALIPDKMNPFKGGGNTPPLTDEVVEIFPKGGGN